MMDDLILNASFQQLHDIIGRVGWTNIEFISIVPFRFSVLSSHHFLIKVLIEMQVGTNYYNFILILVCIIAGNAFILIR